MREYPSREITYARRVTDIYNRVADSLGAKKAMMFNEFVRGASLLDDERNYRLLSRLEELDSDQLKASVDEMEVVETELKQEHKTSSLYEAFEKIAEIGRTKLFVWTGGEYQELVIDDDDKRFLPWNGVIQVGGPEPKISGITVIAEACDIRMDTHSVSVNGHSFSLD